MLLSENGLVNVSSIWKVFAKLRGACQVQIDWALFRERGMRLTSQDGTAASGSESHRPKPL